MKITRRELGRLIREQIKDSVDIDLDSQLEDVPVPAEDSEWSHTEFKDGWGPNDAENWEREQRAAMDTSWYDEDEESEEEESEEDPFEISMMDRIRDMEDAERRAESDRYFHEDEDTEEDSIDDNSPGRTSIR